MICRNTVSFILETKINTEEHFDYIRNHHELLSKIPIELRKDITGVDEWLDTIKIISYYVISKLDSKLKSILVDISMDINKILKGIPSYDHEPLINLTSKEIYFK